MRKLSILLASIAGLVAASSAMGEPGATGPYGSAAEIVPAEDLNAFQRDVLDRHNMGRKKAQVAPLVWNAKLAEDARRYARVLADRNAGLVHSTYEGRNKAGENLWAGTFGVYPGQAMVQRFLDEESYFKPGVFPDVTTTGRWQDVGHFTQIIWPDTREVGCALEFTRDRKMEYLVCRYWPTGNISGYHMTGKGPAGGLDKG